MDSTKIFLVYGSEKKQILSYQADFTKTPAWFDFTVKDGSGTIQLKSLIQFINDDLVLWQLFQGIHKAGTFCQGNRRYFIPAQEEVSEYRTAEQGREEYRTRNKD